MKHDDRFADMNAPDDETPVAATPEYLAMLRAVSGRAPTGDVDWAAFHARLNAHAELPLARLAHSGTTGGVRRATAPSRRRATTWWEYASLPSRVWRPVAAAAAIAIVASIHALRNDITEAGATDVVTLAAGEAQTARGAFEAAVTSGTSSGTIASYLVPSAVEATSPGVISDSSTGQ
jgi:hypothetical protein